MPVTIALAGTHSRLGYSVLAALRSPELKPSFRPLVVVIRRPQDPQAPPRFEPLQYILTDYQDYETLAEQLDGVDVVVNLIEYNNNDPEGTRGKWDILAYACYQAGVKLYIAPEFGIDSGISASVSDPMLLAKKNHAHRARNEFQLKTIQLFCGLLMEDYIPNGSPVGINLPQFSVDVVGVPGMQEPRITFTAGADVGMAIVAAAKFLHATPRNQLPPKMQISGHTCTMNELADLWQTRTGYQVRRRPVDVNIYRQLGQGASYQDLLRRACGEGWLNYGSSNYNEWLNRPDSAWKWTSLEYFINNNGLIP